MKSLKINNLVKVQSQIDNWTHQFFNDESCEYDSKLASLASCISASIEEFYDYYTSNDVLSDMALNYIK